MRWEEVPGPSVRFTSSRENSSWVGESRLEEVEVEEKVGRARREGEKSELEPVSVSSSSGRYVSISRSHAKEE